MSKRTSEGFRREIVALFVFAVLLAPLLGALLWGRMPGQAGTRASPPAGGQVKLRGAPVSGGPLSLNKDDRQYLMGLLLECLEALKASEALPRIEDAPQVCRRPERRYVFVTLYAPGRQAVNAVARESSLAESTRAVAVRLFELPAFVQRGFSRTEAVRARFDILTGEQELPAAQRDQFASLALGEPMGLALRVGEKLHVFLPGDIADYRAGDHMEMLQALCQDAGIPGRWGEKRQRISLLRTACFVNSAPGGTYCLQAVRGLPLVREVGLAQVRRSCKLSARYLVRAQRGGRAFPLNVESAAGGSGAGGVQAPARIARALARYCAWQEDEDSLLAVKRLLTWLVGRVHAPRSGPDVAFVRSDDTLQHAALEDAAAVLSAFCEYRGASEDGTWDDLIERLGNFLLFLQGEEGSFQAAYDPALKLKTPLKQFA